MHIRRAREALAAGRPATRRAFVGAAGAAAAVVAGGVLFGCAPAAKGPAAGNGEGGGQGASASGSRDQRVEALMGSMAEHERLCQLLCVTPEALTGMGQVIRASDATRSALVRRPVGGLAYFADNVGGPEQVAQMLAATRDFALDACGIPPLLCVDEEGGQVARVANRAGMGVDNVGDMADIGAGADPAEARSAAEYVGGYLRGMGFNVDFAPVCDVASNPESDTMRRRSFGANPQLVARMVAAQVEGFAAAGVLCCPKHFPGIGAAVGDSHEGRIVFEGAEADLEATELVPFRAAIEAGAPMVMVGHLSVPAVTGDDAPACLASAVVDGLLRRRLGFEGVVVTDSLSMGAVERYCSAGEAVVLALEAGCDVLLMPPDVDEALEALKAALAEGRLCWDRIDESVRRILRAKLGHLGPF